MANIFRAPRWPPYLVGAGIGVLSWATFYFMDKTLGTSTTFVNVVGLVERAVAPDHVVATPYLARQVLEKPAIDWQFALVLMLPVGAFVSSTLSRSRRVEHVPATWAARFGSSRVLRYAAAFVGGAMLLFGARLADGCTSGHGISGGLQLAVSSWVFLVAMFVAGIATAFLFYGSAALPARPGPGEDAPHG
jgi:hypothetical protein